LLRYDVYSGAQRLDLRGSVQFRGLHYTPAAQQPSWDYHPELVRIRTELAELPPLVGQDEVQALGRSLALVEAGSAYVLHVGECAELFAMASPAGIERRISLYRGLADRLAHGSGQNVVLLARMAGQHAKPRSQPTETLPDGRRLPAYRGDAVNSLRGLTGARQPDPWRMLTSYHRSRDTLRLLASHDHLVRPVFVSHEALLRDYEEPLTRGDRVPYSASGHLLWIGDRTRRLWNWHIQWAKVIANPVAVKLGPTATPDDVVEIVRALNPRREPGRLSLIARMGANAAADRLSQLAATVGAARTPVVWQCDPMHGNTRKLGTAKVRLLPDIRAEITSFVQTLRGAGCHPGGLHLEVTPEDVHECHNDLAGTSGQDSNPPCDPRLNPQQAMEIVDHFANEIRT
jgi:3-deoxy-7-phosphoheptulonate synthase